MHHHWSYPPGRPWPPCLVRVRLRVRYRDRVRDRVRDRDRVMVRVLGSG